MSQSETNQRKNTENVPHHDGLTYTVAETPAEVCAAWSLVYRAYRRIRIIESNPHGIHAPPHTKTNDLAVIRGTLGQQCVSTITSMLDHPEHGLPLDSVYPDELAALRQQGHKLVEVGLFADRRKEFDRSIYCLLDLMRWATYFAVEMLQTPYAVIGVHPHHAKFYSKILGFQPMGEVEAYGTVNDAPVQLLTLNWIESIASPRPPRGMRYFIENPIALTTYQHRSFQQQSNIQTRIAG